MSIPQLRRSVRRITDDVRETNPRAVCNMVLNGIEAALRLERPFSRPVRIDVALTKACNLRCVQCISYGSVKAVRWLPFELYRQLARVLFPAAMKVEFCSGGEPFLYPRLRSALALARQYRCLTDASSNGMLLTRNVAHWLAEDQSLLDLRISFDGARKETLEKWRRGASYETILKNISYISSLKKAGGLAYPRLSLRFTIMRSNADELPELFSLCDRYGFERIQVQYLIVSNAVDLDESMYYHREHCREIFAKARALADSHGIQLDLPREMTNELRREKCVQPWNGIRIDTDGSIRCCPRAWRQRIGFWDDGWKSVWHGPAWREVRRTLASDRPYLPYCRTCAYQWGIEAEAAKRVDPGSDLFVIPGLEDLQVPFNQRAEENISALSQAGPAGLAVRGRPVSSRSNDMPSA